MNVRNGSGAIYFAEKNGDRSGSRLLLLVSMRTTKSLYFFTLPQTEGLRDYIEAGQNYEITKKKIVCM